MSETGCVDVDRISLCVRTNVHETHWNTEPLSLEPFVQHHQDQHYHQPSVTLTAPQALGVYWKLRRHPQTHKHMLMQTMIQYVSLHSGLTSSRLALRESSVCVRYYQPTADLWLVQRANTLHTHTYTVQQSHTSVFNEPTVHFEMCRQ